MAQILSINTSFGGFETRLKFIKFGYRARNLKNQENTTQVYTVAGPYLQLGLSDLSCIQFCKELSS